MQPATFRCADASRERHEVLTGSALPTKAWLLIESPGAWQHHAWPGLCAADDHTAERVAQWLKAHTGRVQLIRRPGQRNAHAEPPFRWFYYGPECAWKGTWTELSHLADAVERISAGHSPLHALPGDSDPMVLVCAHAQHDVCCAVRGRSVAAALHSWRPEAVWETSHLGGDRFAANVLLLPSAVMLGQVDDQDPVEVVHAALNGHLSAATLRGIAGVEPAHQAAYTYVLTDHPQWSLTEVAVTGAICSDDHWSVTVETPAGERSYQFTEGQTEPQVNSCKSSRAVPVRLFTRI